MRVLFSLCFFSLLLAAAPAPTPKAVAPKALDKKAVLTALAMLADTKIPADKLHCEINGALEKKDGSFTYNDVRVRDLFVRQVLWSYLESASKAQELTCDGRGKQECKWWFGEKETAKQPGWSIVLNFIYDQKTKSIPKASLECLQIP